MSFLIDLSKSAIEKYLRNKSILDVPKDTPKEFFKKSAGVFVSIHANNGELRGCIGTIEPKKNCIAEEVIANAISAATQDIRFAPISPAEIQNLVINVDVLGKPELILKNLITVNQLPLASLDPKKYGVIVKTQDGRTGLLLPDIEGVESPQEQIKICLSKAGAFSSEQFYLYRFSVIRYK